MPHTPSQSQRYTRSNSNPNANISLLDIKTLIEKSTSEILDTMRSEIDRLNMTISSLIHRIDELEKRSQKHSENYAKLEVEVKNLQTFEDEKAEELLHEMEQRNYRRSNIIISGIPEQTRGLVDETNNKDMDFILDLFRRLDVTLSIAPNLHRLGNPRSGRPRSIRVCGLESSTKMKILQKSRNLKNDQVFRGVFINADLTPQQQLKAKELRDELKSRRAAGERDVVIFRGKIMHTSQIQNFR